jgi:hypothetical protein
MSQRYWIRPSTGAIAQPKDEVQRWGRLAEQLLPRQITREQFGAQQAQIPEMSERLRYTRALLDPLFQMEQCIHKMMV